MTAEEMLPSLLELNKRCEPPLEAEAVEEIARSIGEYPDEAEGKGAKQTIASRLVELVTNSGAELFRTAEGDTYISVPVAGHRETYPLKGRQAETYIRKLYYDETASAVGNQPLADALGTLRAKAVFEGPVLPVAVRVGEFGGDLYVDLGNDAWDAVRIHGRGWEIVQSPPVRFRRPGGLMPLPTPVHGGSIERLRTYLNVDNDEDFRLLVTAMATSLFPTGPYVVTIFQGEQGSAKSTNTRVIRALVDPNKAAVRTRPRDSRDLMISATNAWMLAYDNLSGVSTELSDSICRLATGGGFATRELYSDAEEMIFEAQRPVILNGIDDLATRSDLLDRSLLLLLPRIPPEKRRDEQRFWAEFARDAPLLLGALLDVLVVARRDVDAVRLGVTPRMADFARRGAAAASALGWTVEEFIRAYHENRNVGHVGAVEGSVVAQAIAQFVSKEGTWEGTATELLAELETDRAGKDRRAKGWPKSPRALADALRRAAPNLLALGIEASFSRESNKERTRLIGLKMAGAEDGDPASDSSSSSEQVQYDEFALDAADDMDDVDAAFQPALLMPESAGEQASDRCPACNARPAPPGGLCFPCTAEAEA